MKFQKIICLCIAAVLLITITGCQNPSGAETESSVVSTAQASTTQPLTTAPEPTAPARTPQTIGNMQLQTLYYKPQMAPAVYCVDARTLSDTRRAVLHCIQGLAARNDAACIYIITDSNDTFWRDHTRDDYGVIFKNISYSELCGKYADQIKVLAVYDETSSYQYAVAQTYASVYDGVVVPRSALESLRHTFPQAEIVSLDETLTDPGQAADWMIENLLPSCNKNYIGIADIDSAYNDYLYATKTATLTVNPEDAAQTAALKKLLSQTGYILPAVAMTDNDAFVALLSEHGFGALDLGGFSNVTFLASFPVPESDASSPVFTSQLTTGIRAYISICIQNGDLPANDALHTLMRSATRGSTPISVELNPSFIELAPPVFAWYNTGRRASTAFYSANTGYMQIDADKMSASVLQSFLLINRHFLNQCGLTVLSVDTISAEKIPLFSDQLYLNGILSSGIQSSKIVHEVPMIRCIPVDQLETYTDYALPQSEHVQFICLYISASQLGSDPFEQLEKLVNQYQEQNDGKVEFLLAGNLIKTFQDYYNRQQTVSTTTETTASTTR